MDDDLRSRRRRLRGFSINRLIPNVLTLAALCSGLTAIRFGLQGQMKLAVIAIIVAAIFDALDGRELFNCGLLEPRKISKRHKKLFISEQQTKAMLRYMRDFRS